MLEDMISKTLNNKKNMIGGDYMDLVVNILRFIDSAMDK